MRRTPSTADMLRFFAMILPDCAPHGCHVWMGSGSGSGVNGYGAIRIGGRNVRAHRVAYEAVNGPVPEGKQLDHICNNTRCVNPAHLRPATARENTLRSNSWASWNAARTHCPQGHPYSGSNLYVPRNGQRRCRACKAESEIRRQKRVVASGRCGDCGRPRRRDGWRCRGCADKQAKHARERWAARASG